MEDRRARHPRLRLPPMCALCGRSGAAAADSDGDGDYFDQSHAGQAGQAGVVTERSPFRVNQASRGSRALPGIRARRGVAPRLSIHGPQKPRKRLQLVCVASRSRRSWSVSQAGAPAACLYRRCRPCCVARPSRPSSESKTAAPRRAPYMLHRAACWREAIENPISKSDF